MRGEVQLTVARTDNSSNFGRASESVCIGTGEAKTGTDTNALLRTRLMPATRIKLRNKSGQILHAECLELTIHLRQNRLLIVRRRHERVASNAVRARNKQKDAQQVGGGALSLLYNLSGTSGCWCCWCWRRQRRGREPESKTSASMG